MVEVVHPTQGVTGMVTFNGKDYSVDSEGFLLDHTQWDEDFAKGMARSVKIPGGLTGSHWSVIYCIRKSFEDHDKCPLVSETCRLNRLHLRDLRDLFPTGYLRGACKLAGCTYKEAYVKYSWVMPSGEPIVLPSPENTYQVDVRGFLVDPKQWDEQFAVHRAHELKMPELLKDDHWKIIYFLRAFYKKNKVVPTIYQTCEDNDIEIGDLERMFPDGYHRGAVKIAGLRVR
jgi:TusE/DsrC/DsvC family sulfur relay protein